MAMINLQHTMFIDIQLTNSALTNDRVVIFLEMMYLTTTITIILQPLNRTTCVNRHPQLRTAGFCEQSFTVCMPLVTATSTFGLG